MKQREIKIPLKCNTLLRLIGLTFILPIEFFMVTTLNFKNNIDLHLFIAITILFGVMWAMIESINYIFKRIEEDKPILPFTFKCKCEDDKD